MSNVNTILDFVIKYSAYLSGIISFVYFLFFLGFSPSKVKSRLRIAKEIKVRQLSTWWKNYRIFRMYHHLLETTIKKYEQQNFVNILVAQTVILLITIGCLYLMIDGFIFAVLTSVFFVVVLPIFILYVKHKRIQGEAQAALVEGVILLLQSYRRNNNNMLYSLKDVQNELDGTLKIIFQKFFARMHGNKEEQNLAAETLAFQIGNNWGANLSSNILKAIQEGINIEPILKNMTTDMIEFQKRIRDIETEGREVALMGYMALPASLIFIVLDAEFLIPTGDAYYYHFGTPLGFKVFIITLIVGIVNLIIAIIFGNPKSGL